MKEPFKLTAMSVHDMLWSGFWNHMLAPSKVSCPCHLFETSGRDRLGTRLEQPTSLVGVFVQEIKKWQPVPWFFLAD